MDRQQLRKLAADATPGPWFWRPGHAGVHSDLCKPVWIAEGMPGHPLNILKATENWPPTVADAEYIAAASPNVVLDLLDQLDATETELGPEIGDEHGEWACINPACGVLTYAAEWCPGCGSSHRTPARDCGAER